jgi:hypothetical protein
MAFKNPLLKHNAMNKKYLKILKLQNLLMLLLSLIFLSAFKPYNRHALVVNNKHYNSDTPSREVIIKQLTKKWVSTAYISDSSETPFKGGFTIHLKSDFSFTSFFKPHNHKKGQWKLSDDSTFTLYMKAVDRFRIIELNDTILVAKTLRVSNGIIYKFKSAKQKN